MRSWLTLAGAVVALQGAVVAGQTPPAVGGVPEQAQPLPQRYDVPPKAVRVTRPELPQGMAQPTSDKTVVVRMLIDPRGRVSRATVAKSVPGLDDAALSCVKNWRFEPARRDGRPIAATAEAAVTFKASRTTDEI